MKFIPSPSTLTFGNGPFDVVVIRSPWLNLAGEGEGGEEKGSGKRINGLRQ
jgi:hypothetical protein